MDMLRRPRRNRKSPVIRDLVQENSLSLSDLIYPMFVMEGEGVRSEIASMPGVARFSLDLLLEEMQECVDLGLRTFALFPNLPESKKDKYATESHNPEGLYLQAVKAIKTRFPDIALMTDVAMDPYSSDGHDGIVQERPDGFEIVNDESLVVLAKMAVAQARAGADIIGPSDMMDGRIAYIREALDVEGFTNVSIMAYTAKYAGAFYGPFRDALDSAPRFGDKKTYQMNPANSREALIEAELDYAEGADFLMVKPAMAYLDIIKLLNDNFDLPIAAYNVSGEYAMVKAAAANGWIDGERAMLEILMAMKRAGAKIILTYFAKEVAQLRKS
ncbi:porphobilinogen synthase [Larkinella arboricola]|nr:porphobilinogen synthase [Larkinella arboricola]